MPFETEQVRCSPCPDLAACYTGMPLSPFWGRIFLEQSTIRAVCRSPLVILETGFGS